MLVLTRKLNERLFIGNDICITIVSVKGAQVRIGIDAPANQLILREEVANGRLPQSNARQDSKKHSKRIPQTGKQNQKTTRWKNK